MTGEVAGQGNDDDEEDSEEEEEKGNFIFFKTTTIRKYFLTQPQIIPLTISYPLNHKRFGEPIRYLIIGNNLLSEIIDIAYDYWLWTISMIALFYSPTFYKVI